MQIINPKQRNTVENVPLQKICKVMENLSFKGGYRITNNPDGTDNIHFENEQDYHNFRQQLKYFKPSYNG